MKRWLGTFIILCIFLSGCEAAGDINNMEVISYETVRYTLPSFPGFCTPVVVDKNIYYLAEKGEYSYSIGRLNWFSGESSERKLDFAEKYNIIAYTVDNGGNGYFLISVDEGEAIWNRYFIKQTADGDLLYKKPYSSEVLNSLGYILRIKIRETEVSIDGENGRFILDEYGDILSAEQEVPQEKRELTSFQGAVYHVNENGSDDKMFELIDYGIEHDSLSEILQYDDGIMVAWTYISTGAEVYVFTPCEKQAASLPESAAETELILAVGEADSTVKAAVVEFNKSRGDIHITIKEYAAGEKSAEDGYAGLGADIAGGNAPDLIALRPGGNYKFLVDSGALEDLQPYVEDSIIIHEEDYLKAAWEIGREGGILYGIPTEFSIQTMAGKTALVGEEGGLTFQKIRGLHERYPHMALIGEESKLNVFELCIALRAPEFIDYDRGRAEFEKEEFYSLLAFADGFPQEAGKDDREALLQDCYLYSIESFMEVYRLLGTKEVTFTGYPTGDGSVGSCLNQGNYMYGICSRSEYKEECWEFIEGYLTRHYEQKLPLQFSTRKDVLKKQFEEEFEKHGGEYGGFEAYEAYKELEEVCETAGELQPWEEAMAGILYEELQPYFIGEKTAEKTAGVIQNRVQTYLNEIQ